MGNLENLAAAAVNRLQRGTKGAIVRLFGNDYNGIGAGYIYRDSSVIDLDMLDTEKSEERGLDPSSEDAWRWPSEMPVLLRNEVHVWRVGLRISQSTFARLEESLSDDEIRRSQQYVFQRDRRQFIVARATLRYLLAAYMGCSHHRICFTFDPFGKPALAAGTEKPSLEFNLTHSGELALIAVALGRCVGIDVEQVNAAIQYGEIAPNVMSSDELAVLAALPDETRPSAFITCWTRKEAYAKARGLGLSLQFDQIEVTVDPDERPRLVRTRDDPAETARWTLRNLFPGTGYVATLAVRGPAWQLRCWDWKHGNASS